VQPTLVEHGHQILGHFVAELTPNDYPRLPVIQDPALLVVLSAYRDREHHARLTTEWRDKGTTLTAAVTTLSLRPTARSVIRYQRPGRGRVRSSA
jgi:hypothetical protein